MKLRLLIENDWRSFKELRLQGLKETPKSYMHIYDEEVSRPNQYHVNFIENNYIVGAFDDSCMPEVLVGFAIMSLHGAIKQRHKCTIWGAYVKPAYRSKGIGKEMRLFLFNEAKTLGMSHCISAIVDDNPASLAMHEGVGYEKMYVEKNGIHHRDGSFSNVIHLIKWLVD